MRRVLGVTGSFCFLLSLGVSVAAGAGAHAAADVAKGKEAFEVCGACHNVDTPEAKMGPSMKGLFKRKMLKSGKPVSDESVMTQINNGGNGMPAYQDMLSADEKTNLLAYLHTL